MSFDRAPSSHQQDAHEYERHTAEAVADALSSSSSFDSYYGCGFLAPPPPSSAPLLYGGEQQQSGARKGVRVIEEEEEAEVDLVLSREAALVDVLHGGVDEREHASGDGGQATRQRGRLTLEPLLSVHDCDTAFWLALPLRFLNAWCLRAVLGLRSRFVCSRAEMARDDLDEEGEHSHALGVIGLLVLEHRSAAAPQLEWQTLATEKLAIEVGYRRDGLGADYVVSSLAAARHKDPPEVVKYLFYGAVLALHVLYSLFNTLMRLCALSPVRLSFPRRPVPYYHAPSWPPLVLLCARTLATDTRTGAHGALVRAGRRLRLEAHRHRARLCALASALANAALLLFFALWYGDLACATHPEAQPRQRRETLRAHTTATNGGGAWTLSDDGFSFVFFTKNHHQQQQQQEDDDQGTRREWHVANARMPPPPPRVEVISASTESTPSAHHHQRRAPDLHSHPHSPSHVVEHFTSCSRRVSFATSSGSSFPDRGGGGATREPITSMFSSSNSSSSSSSSSINSRGVYRQTTAANNNSVHNAPGAAQAQASRGRVYEYEERPDDDGGGDEAMAKRPAVPDSWPRVEWLEDEDEDVNMAACAAAAGGGRGRGGEETAEGKLDAEQHCQGGQTTYDKDEGEDEDDGPHEPVTPSGSAHASPLVLSTEIASSSSQRHEHQELDDEQGKSSGAR